MRPSWLERLVRLPGADRRLLLRSILTLGAARLALWVLPFQVVRRLLTRPRQPVASPSVSSERISWALAHAIRVVPQATCLPQALAAEALLTRAHHPVALRIGVVKTPEGRLKAHAWVESGGRIVVGELTQGLSEYTPLPPLPGAR